MSIKAILKNITQYSNSLIEITGGEPLLQKDTAVLCRELLIIGYTVLVETNGTQDISSLPEGVIRIMDVKCPESGESIHFDMNNINHLRSNDEVKFVISNKKDYDWGEAFVIKNNLADKCSIIFSPNTDMVEPKNLAKWIMSTNAPVRLGLQIHKIIWNSDTRGV